MSVIRREDEIITVALNCLYTSNFVTKCKLVVALSDFEAQFCCYDGNSYFLFIGNEWIGSH